MSKISSMMDVGKRSMMNSQTALQTSAHNIANKTTEGYSRQRVEQVTAVPVQSGNLQLGTGARAAQITRITNPALDKQIQAESAKLGFMTGQSESMARVEQVFNEVEGKGLNHYASDFFNSWRELANNPESMTGRALVKETSVALVDQFHHLNDSLTAIEGDLNSQITMKVADINKITKEVADLNAKIMQVEVQGIPANDQRDRRDLLIKNLQEKVDIKVAEGDYGSVSIMTGGNATLVSGLDYKDLQTFKDGKDGRVQVFFKDAPDGQDFVITDRIKGGSIGGILAVRDQTIPEMRNHLDALASSMADEVNAAHAQGIDRRGNVAGSFFEFKDTDEGAAKSISLSDDIFRDPGKIAVASHQSAPGDNTVAHVISNIQFQNVMENGSATMGDYYAANVGEMGARAEAANKGLETQNGIVQQLATLRDSVSGVSLDEETVKMIEHQKAFEASARVIKTADELFDTVLNLKRM